VKVCPNSEIFSYSELFCLQTKHLEKYVQSLIKCDTEERIHTHLTQTIEFFREKHPSLLPYNHDKKFPTAAADCEIAMKKFFEDNRTDNNESSSVQQIKRKFFDFINEADQSERSLRNELLRLLARQGKSRPVLPLELETRIILLRLKFETVCLQVSRHVQNQIHDHMKSSQLSKAERNLGKDVQAELLKWFHSHLEDPYPRFEEKEELAMRLGISPKQVAYWFANKRVRYKKKFQNSDKPSLELPSVTYQPLNLHSSPPSKRRKVD